jgi:hypothetical protein
MEPEITPAADELEREAILVALERSRDGDAPAYGSAWREAALHEANGLDEDEAVPHTGRPRSARGATRA